MPPTLQDRERVPGSVIFLFPKGDQRAATVVMPDCRTRGHCPTVPPVSFSSPSLSLQSLLRVFLIICVACMVRSGAVAQPNSCEVTWLPSVGVSFDTIPSTTPQIVSAGDTIHAIWFGDASLTGPDIHDGIEYTVSTDGGTSFAPQRRLVSFDSCLGTPGYLAGAGSWLYIAFLAPMDSSPYYGTAVIVSSDGGASWSAPARLLRGVTPRIIAAEESTACIHFVDPFSHTSGILRSDDHGAHWIVASRSAPALNDFMFQGGILHAVTSELDFIHEEVAYYFSGNGGASWIGPTYVSNEDAVPSLEPRIAVDVQGTVSVVWNDTGSIVYRRSSGVNSEGDLLWEPQQVLSSGRSAIFSDVAAEGPFVSVVWDTDLGQRHGIRLRPSSSGGQSYCAIDTPTASSDAVEPAIEIDREGVILVWSEINGSNSEIVSQRGILHRDLVPKSFTLTQNFPNPFNGSTVISYDLPYLESVNLSVYNILGQRVVTLVDGIQPPAHYEVRLDASRLPSGVYFYRLRTWHFLETKRMVVAK